MKNDISQNFASEYQGTLCEVLTADNRLLFVGEIGHYDKAFNELQVNLRRGSSTPQGMIFHTEVKLSLHPAGMRDQVVLFRGLVSRCSQEFWRVELTDYISSRENRGSFRQNVKTSGVVRRLCADGNPEGESYPCILVDVSLTGIGLQCGKLYQPKEKLCLSEITLLKGGTQYTFLCRVVRRENIEKTDQYKYGCGFLEMSGRQEDQLCRDILALQAQSIRERQRKL